ncbi:MAG: 16S rRNA (guanine(527)-N(7))-methyltransferase RsmG, partial [Gaiellaceae bacterium]
PASSGPARRAARDHAGANGARNSRNPRGPTRAMTQRRPPALDYVSRDFTSVLRRQNWDALLPAILRVTSDTSTAVSELRDFARLLLEWNGGVSNLISRNDVARLVERHFSESVEPAHWLASSGATRWLDLGSGGGFPAIPLAMLGVGKSWTLVESRRNKTLFLLKTVQQLKLSSVQVVRERIENLPEPDREASFDGFTSRATMPLDQTLEQAARFIAPGGFAFLWKGSRREEEMAGSGRWKTSWELDGLLGVGSAGTAVARFIRK